MKKVVHRTFFIWKFDEEQKWLNKMSQDGWLLNRVSFCTYEFEQGEKDKYQYAIELLDGMVCSKKNREYLEFVEETGIKYIGRTGNWAYFRKEKDREYEFNMYSDKESKLKYLKRIYIVPLLLAITNLLCGINECFLLPHEKNFIFGTINFMVAGLCGYAYYKIRKKRKEILKDNNITQ